MSTAQEVILKVRDSLSDPSGQRFDDARLLRLLDEGHKTIAAVTGILRTRAELDIVELQNTYLLPGEAHRVLRIVYRGEALPLYSHAQMDKQFATDWELHYGDRVRAIVYDKSSLGSLKVYPIPVAPTNLDALSSIYGVLAGSDSIVVADTYGVLTDVESTVPSEGTFLNDKLRVYYTRIPEAVTALTDELSTPLILDPALRYFVVGMALADNKDTQSIAVAERNMAKFQQELNIARRDNYYDGTATQTQYQTPYVGGFQ